MSVVSAMPDVVSKGADKASRTAGTVTDIFGHRFVVDTTGEKILADLGPKGSERIVVATGDKVEIEGEQKPTEIKVRRISVNGGVMRFTGHGEPKHDKHHGSDDKLFGPDEAKAIARSEGYVLIGELRRYKKHFEVLAKLPERTIEIHIHPDGVRDHSMEGEKQ